MATVREAITLAESGRADAARQAFARHVADGAPQAHKSYAIFLQQRGESDAARAILESGLDLDPSLHFLLFRIVTRTEGSAEEWEARDGGGFELRINS